MLEILQILDPHGLIFDKITVPIKQYLLKRTDTLRCIISHLTDDGENYFKLSNKMVRDPIFLNQLDATDLLSGKLECPKYLMIMGSATTWDKDCLRYSWYMSQSIQKDGAGPKISLPVSC